MAAEIDNCNIIKCLLDHGGEQCLNVRWMGIWTPLSLAVKNGHFNNVKMLVEKGTDLTLEYEGKKIFDVADECYQKFCDEHAGNMRGDRELIVAFNDRKAIAEYLYLIS
jgi:ankyrin repeat protein